MLSVRTVLLLVFDYVDPGRRKGCPCGLPVDPCGPLGDGCGIIRLPGLHGAPILSGHATVHAAVPFVIAAELNLLEAGVGRPKHDPSLVVRVAAHHGHFGGAPIPGALLGEQLGRFNVYGPRYYNIIPRISGDHIFRGLRGRCVPIHHLILLAETNRVRQLLGRVTLGGGAGWQVQGLELLGGTGGVFCLSWLAKGAFSRI